MIQLTDRQVEFLKEEFAMEFPGNKPISLGLSDLARLCVLCSDIEEEESIRCQDNAELSERGELAAKLADIFHNEDVEG